MYLKMAKRVLLETDKRLLWRFMINFGLRGAWSVIRFKQRLKRGTYFPPFLYISVTNSCNLRCQGCWVDVSAKSQKLSEADLHRVIREAADAGNSFFGILGGEPFLYKGLLDILGQHRDCYFQIFSNGHTITDEVAGRMREIGNVTPLVSIEGTELISDERRGDTRVLSRTLQGLDHCLDHKLLTGVATSLCRSNLDDLLNEAWVDRLIERGVLYLWYYTYRAVGPDPRPELALTPEQQLRVRRFIVESRVRKPIAFIDAYYDHQGTALCPAVTGISHHINPWGDIEPCPVIQFAREKVTDDRGLFRTISESDYLRDFRETTGRATRGCVVLEDPALLKQLIERQGARDSTVRQTAMHELEAMFSKPSQYRPGEEIPEQSLAYKLAKKFFFHDFGAYRNLEHDKRD